MHLDGRCQVQHLQAKQAETSRRLPGTCFWSCKSERAVQTAVFQQKHTVWKGGCTASADTSLITQHRRTDRLMKNAVWEQNISTTSC